ncbi:MAG: DUF3307 domain-containing protein [Lachnospiraceae bacterium]|nr:DUF3307 domain-containing protein [Lachnospiraceae bacterium]MCI9674815.1 DUF3307 domain-containing protein [Lachnospiraceae bacterium]
MSIGWHSILPSMCYFIFNLQIPSWAFQKSNKTKQSRRTVISHLFISSVLYVCLYYISPMYVKNFVIICCVYVCSQTFWQSAPLEIYDRQNDYSLFFIPIVFTFFIPNQSTIKQHSTNCGYCTCRCLV